MKNWKKIRVFQDSTLEKTIKIIDKTATKFAVVTDNNDELIGVVTDGDIRRSILKHLDLNITINKIMNKHPVFLDASCSEFELLSTMRSKSVHHIPIVNKNKKVVKVISLSELVGIEKKENEILIMAGGLGTRLKPLTNNTPKPMLLINEKPILEYIIENFIKQGFYKFKISVNYKYQIIKNYFGDGSKWNIDITYLQEKETLGTAGCLSIYKNKPKSKFIVINGDVITNLKFNDLLNFHDEEKSIATVVLKKEKLSIPYGVVNISDTKITSIDEKPTSNYFVNAGIYVFDPKIFNYISSGKLDMPELIQHTINSNETVSGYPLKKSLILRIEEFNKIA